MNRWPDVEHALRYLEVADTIPHRSEGEAALVEHLLVGAGRVLDLGCGDGELPLLAGVRATEAKG